MVQCSCCHRCFREDRLAVHEPICRKSSESHRHVFESRTQRCRAIGSHWWILEEETGKARMPASSHSSASSAQPSAKAPGSPGVLAKAKAATQRATVDRAGSGRRPQSTPSRAQKSARSETPQPRRQPEKKATGPAIRGQPQDMRTAPAPDPASTPQTGRRRPSLGHSTAREACHTPKRSSKPQSGSASRASSCPHASAVSSTSRKRPSVVAGSPFSPTRAMPGSSRDRPITAGTELCLTGGSSSSTARVSTTKAHVELDTASVSCTSPRTPSPRGASHHPLCRQGSCRSMSADLSLSNSSSYGQQADAPGASLPSVPVLPPLQGDDIAGEGTKPLDEALPEMAVGTNAYMQISHASLESLEAHSAFLKSSSLDDNTFSTSASSEQHTSKQNTADMLPHGDGGHFSEPYSSELQDYTAGNAADAAENAPAAGSTEGSHRWQSMLDDVAVLSAQVDELLQRQRHLFGEPGQGQPASCREAWVHEPSSLGNRHLFAEPGRGLPGSCPEAPGSPGSVGPSAELATVPERRYDPCRYAAPGVARTEGGECSMEQATPPQGTGEFAGSILDSMDERSLLVQARLHEQARQVFARRCSLERWRNSSHGSGPRGGGGAAVRETESPAGDWGALPPGNACITSAAWAAPACL